VVPGYRVEERIGIGGFGEVFRARHELIGREVAIKVLHAQYAASSEAVARFIAEARAVNQISHPGIVEIFDFGVLPTGREYVVMELLRGRTLRDVLRQQIRIGLDAALPILHGIAEAIDAAHSAGIAHRDLKPDNVFVLDDGRIKLIDFGLAKLTREVSAPITETGSVFGTPLYMSPEQCRGRASDVRTDYYSFGVLAYHVLVGEPPFSGSALEIALHHLNDRPEAPSARCAELPARADAVILELLAKDPLLRPAPLVDAVARLAGLAPITRRDAAAQLLAEVRATSTIIAPDIARELAHDDHAPTVVETLAGEPLAAVIARGGLAASDAIPIVLAIARVLAGAHASGLAHRGITPRTVFVLAGGRIKLLDLGTTHRVDVEATCYRAPEQCRDDGEVDVRCDVYSCGCLLVALTTGTPPFVGTSIEEIVAKHLHDPAPAFSGSPKLAAVVSRCLAKRPGERYASAGELALALAPLVAGSARASRRLPFLAAGLALGLVVAAVLLVIRSPESTSMAACRPLTACPTSVGCGSIPDGCGGELTCPGTCQVLGAVPAYASAGDYVAFDGTFGASATVTFPGGWGVNATIEGPHRISALVPMNVTDGKLTITTGGSQLPSIVFRRTAYAATLQPFQRHDVQTGGARQASHLAIGRFAAAVVATHDFVYVIGGYGSAYRASVERAAINADGTLGAFAEVATMTTPRAAANALVIGKHLYVIGGDDGRSVSDTIERAELHADGSLGAFAAVPGKLVGRTGASAIVAGNRLLLIGGVFHGGKVAPPERAVIAADGSIGPFEAAPPLASHRESPSAIVVHNAIWLIGGLDEHQQPLGSVERAEIGADGSIGAFSVVPEVRLVTPRVRPAVIAIGDMVYVIGGGSLRSVERARLDDEPTTFVEVPELALHTPRDQPKAIVAGNSLYVISGRRNRIDEATIERASIIGSSVIDAFVLDGAVRTSAARAGHASVVVGNGLYHLGGDGGGFALASVERAPIAINGWLDGFTPVPALALPEPRADATVATIGNAVFLIGGRGKTGPIASLVRAAIGSDRTLGPFSTVDSVTLVTARSEASAVILGDALYVIGGRDAGGRALATIERASINRDGTLGAFSLAALALPTPRFGHRTAVIRDMLYVVGGLGDQGPVLEIVGARIAADSALGAFSTGPRLRAGRRRHSLESVGTMLYAIGGVVGQGPSVERAVITPDGSLEPFAPARDVAFDAARAGHTTTTIGNYVYAIGGTGSSTDPNARRNAVDRANLR